MISIIARLLFDLLRALKSPQKFRTPGCSSANFLGSWYISGLKSKSCYEIWTFWWNFLKKMNEKFLRFWENQSALKVFTWDEKQRNIVCLDHHHHHCVIYAACCRLEELRAVHRPKMKKSNPNMHRHIFTMGPKMKILSIYRRSSPFYYA